MQALQKRGLQMIDESVWGVCSVCKRGFEDSREPGGMWNHGCTGNHASTNWHAKLNPDNTPWIPGYKFCVKQASIKSTRTRVHRQPRKYYVFFEIDREGVLREVGGVKARPETLERVADLYAQERPGSNWYPGAGE